MTEKSSAGKTTLTLDVLLTIARMAALEVEGVKRMATIKGSVNDLFKRANEGIRITVEDNIVFIDLYLILEKDVNIREVSRTVQQTVTRAIAEMTGMDVGYINIHIEDIEYSTEV
jgi:uncharacterized alkaline shock family protein YloU